MDRDASFNLQLIITEQCNLRCLYCFEIDKSEQTMPVELAKEILDRELQNLNGYKEIRIDLAGGEPFLHFSYLKDVVDFCVTNKERWNKKFYFFICSNLTLLNGEIKEWLRANKDWVVLGTSLDGTKEAHDHYRCCSYDRVVEQIPFYRELYPNQGVKMTIGPDTIDSIYEGIKNIESLGLSVSANVVYEPVWKDIESKKDYLRRFAKQLGLVVDHYARYSKFEIPMLVDLPIKLLLTEPEPEHRWCGSGRTMRAYDIDGRALPCHRFTKFCTNKIYMGPESVGPRVETKCDTCMFAHICPTCPGYNWQVNGHPDSRTSHHCEFIKLQFLATAKLHVLKNYELVSKLADGASLDENDPDLRLLRNIKASYLVMNTLSEEDIIENAVC